jgi:tRNA A-37 threonylcarbamoyl transferase component Bud32
VDVSLFSRRVQCPTCASSFRVEIFELASVSDFDGLPLAAETPIGSDELESNDSENLSKSMNKAARNPAKRIDRFELREKLGQGGMGRVYRAYDPKLEREVALKLPALGDNDDANAQRLKMEAKAAACLTHPNIVPIHETGQIDGQFYIVAQLVRGQTLKDRLETQPPDFRQAVEWTKQLAEALAYAHEQRIVHRDVKPANIMINERGEALLMDFGLAKRLNEDAGMTLEGTVLGTAYYMSPEQARGEIANVRAASDQYSLGVVLYEMLAGKRPFEGPYHSVLVQVIGREPIDVRRHRPEVPQALAEICRIAMNKSPANRFASAGAMSAELDRWLSSPVTPPPPPCRVQSHRRANVFSPAGWRIACATTAAVVACGGLLAWYVGGGGGRPAPVATAATAPTPKQVTAAMPPLEIMPATSEANVRSSSSDGDVTGYGSHPANAALAEQPPAVDAEQFAVFAGRLQQSRAALQKTNFSGNPEKSPYCESAIRELDASIEDLARGIFPDARLKSAATDLELLQQMDLPVGNRKLLEQAQEHLRATLDGKRLQVEDK